MSIKQRIERAEKAVGIGGKRANAPTIIFFATNCGRDDTMPHFPEPVEQWVTVKETATGETEQTSLPRILFADPWLEYETRHGLKPGTLSQHELRGKVPFAELLAAATGQTQSQGERPSCTTG